MSSDGSQLSANLLAASRSAEEGRFAELERRLADIDAYRLGREPERLAFWINLYNAKVIQEFKERPRRGHLFRHRRLFGKAGYLIGEDRFTLNVIEHGLLRRNAKPPKSLRRTLRSGDRRLEAAPSKLDPRIQFALNCAAASCPPIRAYEPDAIEEQLELATKSYFETESSFDEATGKLTLPYLMKLYPNDFGGKGKHAIWAVPYLRADARARVMGVAEPEWDGSLEYGAYDWTINI